MKSGFHIIVATDQEGGIGKAGRLPWDLPSDMKHFKQVTTQTENLEKKNAVIMGRKTWESLPEKYRPLPNRLNCVLTRKEEYPLPEGVLRFSALDTAVQNLMDEREERGIDQIFVIGGGDVYRQALSHPALKKLFCTEVMERFDCDVYLAIPYQNFEAVLSSEVFEENGLRYCFREYERS